MLTAAGDEPRANSNPPQHHYATTLGSNAAGAAASGPTPASPATAAFAPFHEPAPKKPEPPRDDVEDLLSRFM